MWREVDPTPSLPPLCAAYTLALLSIPLSPVVGIAWENPAELAWRRSFGLGTWLVRAGLVHTGWHLGRLAVHGHIRCSCKQSCGSC